MEEVHKDLLLVQRVNLVENMNMRGGLLSQLMARKVIDPRMYREIKNGRTLDQQAEELLDILPQCGSKAFSLFCQALIADKQSEVVSLYLTPESELSPENAGSQQNDKGAATPVQETVNSKSTGMCNLSGPSSSESSSDREALPVTVHEDYTQESYRRNLEPGELVYVDANRREQFSGRSGVDSEHEARFIYKNSLLDPSGVSRSITTVLMGQSGYQYVKEPYGLSVNRPKLSQGSFISPSKLQLYNEKECFERQHGAFVVKDSIPKRPDLCQMSSKDYELLAQPQYVFSNVNSASQKSSFLNAHSDSNSDNISIQAQTDLLSTQMKPFLVREFLESPTRYIETKENLHNGQREMVTLHRHVERVLPVSSCLDLQQEELPEQGASREMPRLLRNDSVDTMNKRPLPDCGEPDNKRFCEDVDSVPRAVVLSQNNRLKVIDNQEPISIISETKRMTSQPKVYVESDSKQDGAALLGVMDDPEIDLTDGPITVHVELSSRQFYLHNYKKAYQMARIPRGKALVLNVNRVVGKTDRRGTDIDRDNLHNLLCQLHFDVTVYNDEDGLTALEIVKKLQDFSQHAGHRTSDCTVVCILSHGEEGYIFGADGKKFELDAVFSLFDNTCCPDLRGKPKMFIVQACRGGALDRGVQYYPDEHDGSDPRVRQVPSMSDMLICYPTQEGRCPPCLTCSSATLHRKATTRGGIETEAAGMWRPLFRCS
ncbi:uncharacterized protein LOC127880891 isoform X2 [Dreissena polymorpha]|uniref:uncharacterized protein LOC127880891 isoform X2 n=1 Tax=Dreissena polymorpha TaxID=45954 RepID=UPI0022654A28|nr:uncharacterized protein LOC127880891 isoform X2 [Dreissena polymorpha]